MTNHDDMGDTDEMSDKVSLETTSYSGGVEEDSIDDVQQVRNASKSETAHVQIWRTVVTFVLLATAIAITFITYKYLDNEQIENFEVAYEQFSRAVGSAVTDQQLSIRTNIRQACKIIASQAEATNQTWPFVTIPHIVTSFVPSLQEAKLEWMNVNHAVKGDQVEAWLDYANNNYEKMIKEGHMDEHGDLHELIPTGYTPYLKEFNVRRIFPGGENEPVFIPQQKLRDLNFASFQHVDAMLTYGYINYNTYASDEIQVFLDELLLLQEELLFFASSPYGIPPGISYSEEEHEARHDKTSSVDHPHFVFQTPVQKDPNDPSSEVVAVVAGGGAWDTVLYDLLPENVNGLYAILENDCNQAQTFVIDGRKTVYLGGEDFHEKKYDKYVHFINLALHKHPKFNETVNHCKYSMKLYPSQQFQDQYSNNTPKIFAIAVFVTFMVIILVFFVYDMFVHRRNEKLINNAARTNAIVSSMFPTQIRERLILNGKTENGKKGTHRITDLKSYLNGTSDESAMGNKPLADLFLETTILFADIAGFTAWSSVREPSQVFTLLETVFSAFDQIAKLRRVFKVETVGDCYVAAAGIPEQRADHAIIMVRFARDILTRMDSLVKELEITLGPDTGDLSLRCGLHSGPVTAGVLRGERARFQLFGDTMNTAARVEHTGQVGRIHVSSDTAEALRATGKAGWLIKRDRTVEAKGKGDMQTYWIHPGLDARKRNSHASHSEHSELVDVALEREAEDSTKKRDANGPAERTNRMVDWNVEILLHILRQILARRDAMSKIGHSTAADGQHHSDHRRTPNSTFRPLDEVKEIIHLPDFDKKVATRQQNSDLVEVAPHIIEQLRSLVATIASMYRENSFHNFEHASHVTMSVIKLLARIVAPTDIPLTNSKGDTDEPALAATLHDHTYGITSDPLTQFACAFSALIHDVDHVGVPNAQLVKEKVRIAEIYDNRSVAEQNSVALSWDLFMSDEYRELRECICPTNVELNHFRELVVNAVMATDIVDKELKVLRNGRWDKAFKGHDESTDDAVNRKATIVIEHLIQASDVSHTMQHWHVYRKWNEKFFRECYKAYQDGRAEQNPVDGWYKGEIGFFDFYIIPLAKKLKECGVFGKSSDEYLNYAMTNRKEWERRGEEVVAEMVQSFHSKQ